MSSTRSRSRSPFQPDRVRRPKSMLLIRHLPRKWNFEKIKNFIKENTAASKYMAFVDIIKFSGDCTVKFGSYISAEKARDDLDGLLVEGNKIRVTLCDGKVINPIKKEWIKNTPMKTDERSQENHETYGLSNGYLNSLGIEPPLINKIFVYNLSDEVDEAKIREVFSMAGCIIGIILKKHTDYRPSNERMKVTAKIEYDHPVEAVQAIAMFNNQHLYDRPMMMRLDYIIKGPLRKNITGLKSIGPALGENGEPMRSVRYFLEIQSLRQEIFKKLESITNNSQQLPNSGNQMNEANNQMVNMANQIANTNMTNQMMANMNPNMNLNAFNPGFIVNPMVPNQNMAFQPWAGMIPNPMGVMQNQANTAQTSTWKPLDNQNSVNQGMTQVPNQAMVQGNMSLQGNQGQDDGLNANWSQQQQKFDRRGGGEGYDKVFTDDNMELAESRRDGEERRQESVSETLVFKYLPPSVNFGTLQQKMREIGEVKFVELTGHGRAIVRFMSPREAEQCIRMYDRSRVDGQMIEVKYF